jgi:stringent starvation protein B
MTSNRPYLIRALFDWILDNDMTPHLLVDAEHPDAFVPEEFVEEGRIVLNIAPRAVKELVIGNESISFSARFGGVGRQVDLPPRAVIGIYARENGHGMLFPDDEPAAESASDGGPDDDGDGGGKPEKPGRPSLRVVK